MTHNTLERIWRKTGDIVGLLENEIESRITPPCSRLIVNSDSANWVLDTEARAILDIGRKIGVRVRIGHAMRRRFGCIHYMSQYALTNPATYLAGEGCRYSVAYFHGGPDEPGFEALFKNLIKCKDRLSKVHVSNSTIEAHCLNVGFSTDQIARIPIGLNLSWFPEQSSESRVKAREKLGIPQDSFVVGSFQKDGVGWGEGLEPKLIKGPDIFVETMKRAQNGVPRIYALLGGAARGYVKRGLEACSVPYTESYPRNPESVGQLYQALDVYLVASRVEGGPKALLESMASRIPLVTTRVGQAVDLVEHGKNGWMVEPEDIDGLTEGIITAYEKKEWFERMAPVARETALKEDYMNQASRWRDLFFDGYVER